MLDSTKRSYVDSNSPARQNVDAQLHAAAPAAAKEDADAAGRPPMASRMAAFLLYYLSRALFLSLRLTVVRADLLPGKVESAILVTWHGRTLVPGNLFRNKGYWALVSLSRDGMIQTCILRRYGFQIIRGSTGHGGVRGALIMARNVRAGGVLAFTPDGPRGPTHKVQLGVILMAEKSGAPIIPLGVSVTGRRLLKSWDSYMVPRPFSRAFIVVGEPIAIPPKCDAAMRSTLAGRVEAALNRLEATAESLCGHVPIPEPEPASETDERR